MWTICTVWMFVSLFMVMLGAARTMERNGQGHEQIVSSKFLGYVVVAWLVFGISPVLVVVALAKVLFA